ncbi:hypothetical protein ACQEV9_00050 [Streptomyces chartreusis]|uniref:hypothetical protein n=1 Tax=Streptomyces chartreusis TaxID=1969 RepID=UPI003D8A667B
MHRTSTLLITACLALAGCANSSDGKATAEASASSSVDREGQFVTATQSLEFTTMRPSNDELLTYPPRWCKELDAGHSVEWMFDIFDGGGLYPVAEGWGMEKPAANELLMAGVKVYCPKHLGTVRDQLRKSGEYGAARSLWSRPASPAGTVAHRYADRLRLQAPA